MPEKSNSTVTPSCAMTAMAACVTVAAVFGLTFPGRAYGQSFDSYSELNTDTIARREQSKDYYTAKQNGATTVADQSRAFAAPDGVHMGSFFVFPSLSATTTYDDNIFGSSSNEVGDLKTVFTPSISVRSDLPRHALDFSLSGRIVTFLENSDQNHEDYSASASGALHFDHAHTISASLITELGHEERGSLTSPLTAGEPVPVFHHRASVGVTRDVGRLYGTVSARAERWDYQDVKAINGTTIDQDVRDLSVFGGRIKVGYRISPGFELLASTSANRYLNEGTATLDRDGNGYDALVGLGFETSPLLRFKLLAGYSLRQFDEKTLDDVSTNVFSGDVTWLPTRRMTLRGSVSRNIAETLDDGGNTRIDTEVSAKLDYEIYHNLVGNAGLAYVNSDFSGDNRTDDTWSASLGLEYYHNKNMRFTAGYQYIDRDSSKEEFNAAHNRFTVGAKLQF